MASDGATHRLTVETYLRGWLEQAAHTFRPSAWATYRTRTECHVIPVLGDVELAALSRDDVDALLRRLVTEPRSRGRPLAPRTVASVLVALRGALRDAVADGLITTNVAIGATPPVAIPSTYNPTAPPTWTASELRLFVSATAGQVLHPLWVVAAMTGARPTELLAIWGDDVDRDTAAIAIRRSIHVGAGRSKYVELHPPQSRRVRVDHRVVDLIPTGADDGFIFSDRADPLDPDRLSGEFREAAATYGLPRIGLGGLRHTHAALLLHAGAPVDVVSRRLGHPSVHRDTRAVRRPHPDRRRGRRTPPR